MPFAPNRPHAHIWCSAVTGGRSAITTRQGHWPNTLVHALLVRVVTLEAFVRLANNGQI